MLHIYHKEKIVDPRFKKGRLFNKKIKKSNQLYINLLILCLGVFSKGSERNSHKAILL